MSNTPLTLIEGAYALPRPHPLDDVPVPLRHEWALLASGDSRRNHHRSLYAALLHTICLSNRELLSRRRWQARVGSAPDGQPVVPASSAAARQRAAPHTMHHDVPPDARRAIPRKAAHAPTRIALKPRRPATAKRRASRHWHGIVGGACIVGAVAALAWLATDRHRALRQLIAESPRPVLIATGSHDGQPGTPPPHAGMASRQAIVVDESAATRAPAHAGAASAAAAASAPVHDGVSRRAAGSDTPAQPLPRMHIPPAQRERVSADRLAQPSQHAHLPRAAAMRAARNPSPTLHVRSAAQPGASFAQAWPSRGEYAVVTASAAPPPRGGTSNHQQANIGTGWMSHMTQRRVTEIPDQFGR